MNILGAKYWADRDRFHVQTNNPTEEQLRKDELEEGGEVSGWLETCGPTAAINCLDAIGQDIAVICPGHYRPQPEEVLAGFFNDPANYAKFKTIRPDLDFLKIQGNRVPNLYPLAVGEVFDGFGTFCLSLPRDEVIVNLKLGCPVQLCLKKPGHYIAAVAYDIETAEIIYHDSWPGRTNGPAFALRMGAAEYAVNVQECAIVYEGGEE